MRLDAVSNLSCWSGPSAWSSRPGPRILAAALSLAEWPVSSASGPCPWDCKRRPVFSRTSRAREGCRTGHQGNVRHGCRHGQLIRDHWGNPERLRSERAFTHLCGVVPIPASPRQTGSRHRRHRGGDRSANRALHIAAVVRMRFFSRTRAYVVRRTSEGSPNQRSSDA